MSIIIMWENMWHGNVNNVMSMAALCRNGWPNVTIWLNVSNGNEMANNVNINNNNIIMSISA